MWWFVGRGGDNQLPTTNKPTTNRTIAEVKPDIATHAPTVGGDVPAPRDSQSATPDSQHPTTAQSSTPDAQPPATNVVKKPVVTTPFKHASDQVFAMIATAGENVPPLPGTEEMLEESFYKSYEKPIKINDDDPEDVKAAKQAVNEVREEMKEAVKGGRPVFSDSNLARKVDFFLSVRP